MLQKGPGLALWLVASMLYLAPRNVRGDSVPGRTVYVTALEDLLIVGDQA
jgi:hypothetical protein